MCICNRGGGEYEGLIKRPAEEITISIRDNDSVYGVHIVGVKRLS